MRNSSYLLIPRFITGFPSIPLPLLLTYEVWHAQWRPEVPKDLNQRERGLAGDADLVKEWRKSWLPVSDSWFIFKNELWDIKVTENSYSLLIKKCGLCLGGLCDCLTNKVWEKWRCAEFLSPGIKGPVASIPICMQYSHFIASIQAVKSPSRLEWDPQGKQIRSLANSPAELRDTSQHPT